ncbi:MAG TPA: 5-(carboxyamino)imidazole ribonucleotide mutase [Streptosporangiaceae bacterium]|nr:5-(carboxyamino)imidazole ribonucleotide mutase [Streptosporangiaceae bacterium]
MPTNDDRPLVGLIMGSASDWPFLVPAARLLDEFEVPWERGIFSAHRLPEEMSRYARTAKTRGLKVIIASAGGAAHLPGMIASKTPLPVIGVPRPGKVLDGLDALLSIVQMPAGIPVATMAIGEPGAANAAVLALRILGTSDAEFSARAESYQESLRRRTLAQPDPSAGSYESPWSSVVTPDDLGPG